EVNGIRSLSENGLNNTVKVRLFFGTLETQDRHTIGCCFLLEESCNTLTIWSLVMQDIHTLDSSEFGKELRTRWALVVITSANTVDDSETTRGHTGVGVRGRNHSKIIGLVHF